MPLGKVKNVSIKKNSGLIEILFDDNKVAYLDSGFGLRQVNQACEDHGITSIHQALIEYETDEYNMITFFNIAEVL